MFYIQTGCTRIWSTYRLAGLYQGLVYIHTGWAIPGFDLGLVYRQTGWVVPGYGLYTDWLGCTRVWSTDILTGLYQDVWSTDILAELYQGMVSV